jgi:hypothetical protein
MVCRTKLRVCPSREREFVAAKRATCPPQSQDY